MTVDPKSILDITALDQVVDRLRANAARWAGLAPAAKADLLEQVRGLVGEHAQRWVELSVAGKKLDATSQTVGEEWTSGPWALAAAIDGYIATLRTLARGKKPKPKRVRTRPDSQVVAQVFPRTVFDWLLLNGVTAEVWMQPGVTAETLAEHTAGVYGKREQTGELALVLGGGNINSIPGLDALYELIADRRVALLKLNPVNDYLAPVLKAVFAPLIEPGYLDVICGDATVGAYLTAHSGIDKIHITGSAQTHDAIVFGPGPDGAARKDRDEPILDKPFTSELGGVGPVIVVPGPWSDADIAYQAENIATMKLHNAGANCIAAQVLILPEDWMAGPALLAGVREQFQTLPGRDVYYPGTVNRLDTVIDHYGDATVYGTGAQRRIVLADLDPAADQFAFTQEFFAPALAQVSLPAPGPLAFLRAAIDFANDKLMGTLGATILIHPDTIKDLGPAFDDEIARLRYGAIGVNMWSGVAFLLGEATWGAFPGNSRTDIGSGAGVVHNTLLFDKPQKSVVTGPFRPFPRSVLTGSLDLAPRPPWFVTNATAATTGRRLAQFAARPSWTALPGLFASALRG